MSEHMCTVARFVFIHRELSTADKRLCVYICVYISECVCVCRALFRHTRVHVCTLCLFRRLVSRRRDVVSGALRFFNGPALLSVAYTSIHTHIANAHAATHSSVAAVSNGEPRRSGECVARLRIFLHKTHKHKNAFQARIK